MTPTEEFAKELGSHVRFCKRCMNLLGMDKELCPGCRKYPCTCDTNTELRKKIFKTKK
jgi:hypothetical protein